MIVRAKTKFRLLVLIGSLFLVFASLAVVYVVRKHYIRAQFMAKREAGIAAYQKGDYWSALPPLVEYLGREEYSKDPEAMYAFAESRRRIPTRDYSHLGAAMGQYRKFLQFRPDRDDCLAR